MVYSFGFRIKTASVDPIELHLSVS